MRQATGGHFARQAALGALGRLRDVRRQVLVFSVMSFVLFVPLLAIHQSQSVATDQASQSVAVNSAVGWSQVPILIAVGLSAGFLAGMLGMGGGVLKMSGMLLLLGMDIFFARAVSLITMFFSSAAALWRYAKERLVLWHYALPMIAVGIPGAVIGALVGGELVSSTLTRTFGFFVLFLSFNTLALLFADPGEHLLRFNFDTQPRGQQGYFCGIIGALHGGVCGLLGISGGVIATPLQQGVLNVPLVHAIANTLVTSTAVTAVASAVVLWVGMGRGDFVLMDLIFVDLFMGGAAALAAPLGAHLGARSNVVLLRLLFVALTLAAGLSITAG